MKYLSCRILAIAALISGSLTGCASNTSIALLKNDAKLVEGPPIRDIETPFDRALMCLRPTITKSITFAVGAVVDDTGKEQLSDGGTGKFITQGAGDIVQSALFKAGATLVNRRDPRIMETETKWGIRDVKRIIPVNFYVTGSINSLDFLPGGGAEVQVAGVGPRFRQYRMLVGLDLALTEANTGRIVANVPLQKQIVAREIGAGVGRFFGSTLVSIDFGNNDREALNFSLRQMLNLATFDLLTQVMNPKNYADCRLEINAAHGVLENTGTAAAVQNYEENEIAKQLPPETPPAPTAAPAEMVPATPDASSTTTGGNPNDLPPA